MKDKFFYIVIICLSVGCFSFTAVDNWTALTPKEANQKFMEINQKLVSVSSFSLTVTQRTFRNHTTPSWAFQYDGYVLKQEKNYHTLLMGIHTIQNEKYKLVIDTSKKIILVSNPSEELDISTYFAQNEKNLELCKAINLKKENNNQFINLDYTAKQQFLKTELAFNPDGFPLFIKMYLNKKVVTKTAGVEKTETPRIEMSYSNHSKTPKFKTGEFSEKKYIITSGAKLQLSPAYETYSLKDLRIQSKK